MRVGMPRQAKAAMTPIPSFTPLPRMLQRKCACGGTPGPSGECEECRKKRLQRKTRNSDTSTQPSTFNSQPSAVPPIVHEVLRSPGQPLDASTRAFMEPRFGHDFSRVPTNAAVQSIAPAPLMVSAPDDQLEKQADVTADRITRVLETPISGRFDFSRVRIHTDARATASARDVNANAYTVGKDIVFGAGQFSTATHRGRRLIAHELAHVVQQRGAGGAEINHESDRSGLPRYGPIAASTPVLQRDTAGGGSTEFEDRVTVLSRPTSGPGVVTGQITRIETAPASGSQARQEIHRGEMHLRFDPATCSITIPFGYNFVQAAQATGTGICDDPPAATAVRLLPADRMNRLKASVLADVNRGLNGWFDVKLTGSSCPGRCANRALPIRVDAHEDTAHPDTTITIVNRGGRANAGTICAASWDRSTAVHEGGHQVLGVGDEYAETDERLRATVPQWFRKERVRRDYSAMGPEEDSRFAMFHERHFNAVKTFLENAFPGCTATLQAQSRPVIPDFRIALGGGYASLSGVSGSFLEGGLRIGIPLDRLRRWEFVLGPQINWLTAIDNQRAQEAFLFGARLGLEGATGEGGHGFTAGIFGEAGYGRFSSTDYSRGAAGSRSATAAYGELGLGAGYRTPIIGGSTRFDFRLEGAAGSALGTGIIGPITREIESDPALSRWFRFGLTIGGQF
jgi:hypothetical protein